MGLTVAALAAAGVFSGDGEEVKTTAPIATAPKAEAGKEPAPSEEDSRPKVATLELGGRPTAISAYGGGVWVADSFSPRAHLLPGEREDPVAFRLAGPAADVAATRTGAYFALPEQQSVERRQRADPETRGEVIGINGFPSVLAGENGAVYALSDRAVEAIDVDTGEVADEFRLGGFGSGLALGEGYVWAAVNNREVVRIDPESGEIGSDPVPAPEVFTLTAADAFVWALSASGALTRITPDTLKATVAPQAVRGALDVAVGLGSVWVTSSRRTVTRIDPETLEPRGEPLPVGDEPASIAIGHEAVWVANGGDGTLTRIEP